MPYPLNKILIIAMTIAILPSAFSSAIENDGVFIIVTFPYLYDDIKGVVCPGDTVINIIKPGIDPHEYQLTPGDVDIIKKANIIISTAHTSFELKIKKMVEEGELNSTLIEIPYLHGMKILKNPSTGLDNYHAILFYPENYITLLNYLKQILTSLRPACSKIYEENINKLILKLQNIADISLKLNKVAVLDSPIAQYIAVWLGLNVSYILIKEEEVPIVPRDIEEVEKIVNNHNNSIIVVVNGSRATQYLMDLAGRYGREIILLPNPISSTSIISVLENTLKRLNNTKIEKVYDGRGVWTSSRDMYISILITSAILASTSIIIGILYNRRRGD